MKPKGEIDRKILWVMICLILLIVLLALFYGTAIDLIKKIIMGELTGNG